MSDVAAQSIQHVDYEDAPLTKFQIRVTIAGTGGQFSDGFILGIIGIVITASTNTLGLTPLWVGLLGAASLAGLFLGAVVTGPIADRFGRRHIFAWDMLAFAALSGLQFFIESPSQLLVLRLLIGVVLGADYVVSKSLVTEHAPRRFRGRLMSILAVAWAAGYVAAYLVGFLLTSLEGESWRYMLAASAVPALLILGFRLGVPESPLWLSRHGRTEEAAAVVSRHLGADVRPPSIEPNPARRNIAALFTPKYRKRTMVGALFYICQVIPFFALGTFSPQVMESLGVTSKLGAGAAYNIFLLAGAVLGLLVIDRISRRAFLIGTFFVGAALLAALVVFSDTSSAVKVALFALFALVLAAAVNLEFVYPPELFPTDLRASGVGIAVAASRIGSAASTFLLPVVVAQYNVNAALIGCVVVLAIGGFACWAWAPETRNESLNDVDGDH
ncbi:MFS transporter [Mycolicibacterium goodii]|uniref:MFS transporter n=1 Tax=Mycolicibacterium goodii TaxID=134601 RepID=A0ABS6HNP1_MYCGD|nr:MFS transporter [Mycolicibacterium goodii]OKH75796.1 MFS transporter [Mycobacterium sp. SWH-M5]MBU8817421.1 MFS transporter [Mycolicibacterium goodii]MBU8824279.1 MFS transporter [Mycolicibacterium goodii]MBU8831342.1 MFS transporter [Mycolicibacterium goodii]MBU8837937.1 MFS transporter [Mycolicibacterium goodii]